METKFGVHSEVGQLRKVMVCAPGRALPGVPCASQVAACTAR